MEDFKGDVLDKWTTERRLEPFDGDRVQLELGAVILAFAIAYFKDGMVMQLFLTFFMLTYGVLMTFSKAQFVGTKGRMLFFGAFNAINLFLICGGSLVRYMSWPYASEMVTLGALQCVVYHLFLPANEFRYDKNPSLKFLLWGIALNYGLFVIAFLLDFQSWPFASEVFFVSSLVGVLLLSFVVVLRFLNKNNFVFLSYYIPKLLFIVLMGTNQYLMWLPSARI